MLLYKFVPTNAIAQKVACGVFRFYELKKYIKLEERTGRSDSAEGAVAFNDVECEESMKLLPKGSFNGIEFLCQSVSPDIDYLSQYFIFCMSTKNDRNVIGDSQFAVELDTDIFALFESLLPTPKALASHTGGSKFFSHGLVEYYDIYNHPSPIRDSKWREVYLKHSAFSYQYEYRAAVFASEHFFDRVGKRPLLIERPIHDAEKNKMDFNLKVLIRAGVDEAGWRFLEFDVSEFQANFMGQPCPVLAMND